MNFPTPQQVAKWQTDLVETIMDTLYRSLVRRVFADDPDPVQSVSAVEDEIIKQTVSFTAGVGGLDWKIQAGGAVMVASKMVMAHDYLPDSPELLKFVALYVGGSSHDLVKKKLLSEEVSILNATVFKFDRKPADTGEWNYDINYDSEPEGPPAKRRKTY